MLTSRTGRVRPMAPRTYNPQAWVNDRVAKLSLQEPWARRPGQASAGNRGMENVNRVASLVELTVSSPPWALAIWEAM